MTNPENIVPNQHKLPSRCLTCSDEAVEAVVVAVEGATAVVSMDGAEERVAIELVPEAAPGDVLLCHAGLALQVTDSHKR